MKKVAFVFLCMSMILTSFADERGVRDDSESSGLQYVLEKVYANKWRIAAGVGAGIVAWKLGRDSGARREFDLVAHLQEAGQIAQPPRHASDVNRVYEVLKAVGYIRE